jgi:hypothetical protein
VRTPRPGVLVGARHGVSATTLYPLVTGSGAGCARGRRGATQAVGQRGSTVPPYPTSSTGSRARWTTTRVVPKGNGTNRRAGPPASGKARFRAAVDDSYPREGGRGSRSTFPSPSLSSPRTVLPVAHEVLVDPLRRLDDSRPLARFEGLAGLGDKDRHGLGNVRRNWERRRRRAWGAVEDVADVR